MPGTVADYVVVSDGPTELRIGADIDHSLNFNIPSTAALNQHGILTFMSLNSPTSVNDLNAKVFINDQAVFNYGPTDTNLTRPFQEVLSPNLLKVGQNTILVKVISGAGVFRFSDVVIWFQNKV